MGKNLSKDAADGSSRQTLPRGRWRSHKKAVASAALSTSAADVDGRQQPHSYIVTRLLEGDQISARLELAPAVGATPLPASPASSNAAANGHAAGHVAEPSQRPLEGAGVAMSAVAISADDQQASTLLISPLQCDVVCETSSRVHIRIYDPKRQRFEVRYEDLQADFPVFQKKASAPQYDIDIDEQPFAVTVTRKATGSVLFDTRGTQLWYEDKRLQLSTTLPSNYLYGLGERRKRFLIDCSIEHVLPFWCHAADGSDVNTSDYANSHGVHPFFLGLEEDGSAYGVFFLNSCPMEVHVLPGCPALLSYTVGGGIIDLYVFLGPTPLDVVQQYQEVVGRPALPPYWALGYHLSRWGYGSGAKLNLVVQRNRAAGMPCESQWIDIDLMDSKRNCAYKDGLLPRVVEDLHNNGQKYVVVFDPVVGINQNDPAYVDGVKQGMFVSKFDGLWPLVGKAWCGDVLFIDYTHPSAPEFCKKQAAQLYSVAPFDGIFLDRNEPANLVSGCREDCALVKEHPLDAPKFIPGKLSGRSLFSKTLCPSSRQHRGDHYYVHNLYGHFQLKVMHSVMKELTGKRPLVVSRSTFAGSGKYGGHWSGDNKSSFVDLRYSISEMLDFNLFGIPLVGANVGGFSRECSDELMVRWTQVAAFCPLMRNHNSHPDLCPKDQDPAAFSSAVQEILRSAVLLRYSLLPHLNTLFYESHVQGAPVVRPLFMQYPRDRHTFSIDEQFMWGDSLLISPCLHQGQEHVDAYFPHDIWYNYFTGVRLSKMGTTLTLHTPLDSINVQLRGGCIVPTQVPAVSTSLSRRNPFGLTVALSSKHVASGKLYWDDGESLDPFAEGAYNLISFEAKEGRLSSVVEHSGHYTRMVLSSAQVFGVYVAPQLVCANGRATLFDYNESAKVLRISGLQLSLLMPLSIEWQ